MKNQMDEYVKTIREMNEVERPLSEEVVDEGINEKKKTNTFKLEEAIDDAEMLLSKLFKMMKKEKNNKALEYVEDIQDNLAIISDNYKE